MAGLTLLTLARLLPRLLRTLAALAGLALAGLPLLGTLRALALAGLALTRLALTRLALLRALVALAALALPALALLHSLALLTRLVVMSHGNFLELDDWSAPQVNNRFSSHLFRGRPSEPVRICRHELN